MGVPVKLLRNYGNINAGEVAGYEPAIAKRMVEELHIAVYITSPPADVKVEETKRYFVPNPELTVSKVTRMNVDQLKELAAEHNVAIEEGELKPAILAKVKVVLFPDEA